MSGITVSPVNIEERKNLGIKPGDTVRVWQKIEEKGKTRLQAFEGLVLARKHGNEPGGTFTVRKVSSGVGIEKIFPIFSPVIDKIEIVRRAKVRRAKLYYIRDKVAREARRQLRRMSMMNLGTQSEIEQAAAAEAALQAEAEAPAEAEVTKEEAPAENTEEAPTEETTEEEAGEDKKSE